MEPKKKVNEVVERIAAHPEAIEDVVRSSSGNEYFFRFKGHYFSIAAVTPLGEEAFTFYVYPGEWRSSDDVRKVSDTTGDIPTAHYWGGGAAFEKLYQIVEMKMDGVEAIFEKILAS